MDYVKDNVKEHSDWKPEEKWIHRIENKLIKTTSKKLLDAFIVFKII